MPNSKDNYGEKCRAIFWWRFSYFKEDDTIPKVERDKISDFVNSLKNNITDEKETLSKEYTGFLESNKKILIDEEEYIVRITYYAEKIKGKKKTDEIKRIKLFFFDIYSIKGKKDYFLKFDGKKKTESNCPICNNNSSCTVIVEIKFGKAYLTSICNNNINIEQAIKEEKLRAEKLIKKRNENKSLKKLQ